VSRVRTLLIGYVVIALVAGWPLLSVALASGIASWNGCELHDGFRNPCIVNGADIGGTLYSMGVLGWFMLATIPLGIIAFLVWTTAWLVLLALKRRSGAR
jgi:hypothetical protein